MARIQTDFAIKLIVCSLFVFARLGLPEGYPRKSSTELKTTTRQSVPDAKVFGNLEIRPQWDTLKGSFNSENWAELGLDFKKWKLSYSQDIDTQSTLDSSPSAPIIQDGHIKLKVPNAWTNGDTSFTEEFRAYLPTNTERRDAGMVTMFRNYFTLSQTFSKYVSFAFTEAPIIHVYSDSGVTTTKGAAANPIFENRAILEFDFNLSKTVSFAMPLHFYTTKYRDYMVTAKQNASWEPSLFIWPELRWAINPNFTLGTAYRTNSFFNVDETGTVPGDGGGVFQAIMAVSF